MLSLRNSLKTFMQAMLLVSLCPIVTLSNVLPAYAGASNVTPWRPGQTDFQNLVYGSSSMLDVQAAIGRPADEFVQSTEMYPVIQNMVYYEEGGTGAASVFVLENGLLVGLFYKSPTDQYLDFTFVLTDNGSRAFNYPLNAGYQGFFPQMYTNSLYSMY